MSRHHASRHAERDLHGRLQIADPVDVSYMLSPAAVQLVTRTRDAVHAGPADATGLLRVRDITTTGAWTQPGDTAILPAVAGTSGPDQQ